MVVTTRAKSKKTLNTDCSSAHHHYQTTESAELVGSNDGLLTEILSRLPAKSILRFKSVSKHWLSLLTHRHFTRLYDRLLKSPGLFYGDLYVPFDVENPTPPPVRSLDFCHDRHGIKIMQSCNGLLLCRSNQMKIRSRKYYVFNPTTKQFLVVPPVIGGPTVRESICFMGRAFHPIDCVNFKVVCIYLANQDLNRDDDTYRIQIYSSDTRKWRISHETFSGFVGTFSSKYVAVYWNGGIHWAPWDGPSQDDLNSLYFKLDGEKLQTLPLRSHFLWYFELIEGYVTDGCYFGESQGHLYLVDLSKGDILDVYEMLDDRSRWFLKYQVEFDDLMSAYPPTFQYQAGSYYKFDVLDIVRGEEEKDTFMVLRNPWKIIRYNFMDKSFKPIFDIHERRGNEKDVHHVHRYIETVGSF